MAIFYARGDALVTEDEINQDYADERTPFEPIGLGRPLTLEIRHIYTGEFPRTKKIMRGRLLSARARDMLVTSAVRSQAVFDGAGRAVNVLERNIKSHSHWSNPSAVDSGTRLVWYSPAQIDRQTDVTIEVGFDEYPEEVFENFGAKMQQAAAIPAFASVSLYLTAAGEASQLWAKIAERLFEYPQITFDAPICFRTPGEVSASEGFALVTRKGKQVDRDWLSEHKILDGELVRRDNDKPYRGDIPYVVISLDGSRRDDLTDFAPKAAAAAIVERFYGETDEHDADGPTPLEMIQTAMVLYNDLQFRAKADGAAAELARLRDRGASPDEVAQKQSQVAAYVANISTVHLKPQAASHAPQPPAAGDQPPRSLAAALLRSDAA